MSAYTDSPLFSEIFSDDGDGHDERDDVAADARHVIISGHKYTRRRQDTNRIKRARQQVRGLPSVIAEREWVATWIELIDASVYTPPGTPRAGRILREAYAEGSIRLPVIRDLGRSLLPLASVDAPGRPLTTRSVSAQTVPA
jgi:hypothetical protein